MYRLPPGRDPPWPACAANGCHRHRRPHRRATFAAAASRRRHHHSRWLTNPPWSSKTPLGKVYGFRGVKETRAGLLVQPSLPPLPLHTPLPDQARWISPGEPLPLLCPVSQLRLYLSLEAPHAQVATVATEVPHAQVATAATATVAFPELSQPPRVALKCFPLPLFGRCTPFIVARTHLLSSPL